jgi:phosphocarrier protein HPr
MNVVSLPIRLPEGTLETGESLLGTAIRRHRSRRGLIMRNDVNASAQGRLRTGPCSALHTVQIINPLGLHLRAAEKLVRAAQQFRADIRVTGNGQEINGKSVLDLVALAAECGSQLQLQADGPDAEAALDALVGLVGRGFDED